MPESYVHRIGRTARAGAAGIAISLCDPSERPFLRDIERLTRQKLAGTGGAPAETHETGRPAQPPHQHRPHHPHHGRPSRGRPQQRQPQGKGGSNRHTPATAAG